MKKLLSTVAALAIVFTMGVTAFADGLPSPTSGSNITGTTDATGVEVVVENTKLTSDQEKTLEAAAKSAVGTQEIGSVEVANVWIKDSTTGDDVSDSYKGYPITVTFTFDNDDNVIGVLYWNEANKAWDTAKYEIKDGKAVVTFEHLCNVAFLIKPVKGNGGNGGNSGKTSAQTGYDGIVYIVSAIALAAGAVFFFSTASKQKTVKEVM